MSIPARAARFAVAGYALLIAAWIFGSAPFSSPDEWSHYLRALGIAKGQILGAPVPSFRDPHLDPRQEAWVAQTVRAMTVPPGMAPDGGGCNAFHPESSAACLDRAAAPPAAAVTRLVVNGTYQPAAYLLPGLFLRAASRPATGLLLARLANGIACIALIALAVAALVPVISAGVHLALTPMGLYLAGTLNPSGPEITAAAAFTAGLLALARAGGEKRRATWVAIAVGGAVLCLSRSLGPLWVLMISALWLCWRGPVRTLQALGSAPRAAGISAAVIGAAAFCNRWWEIRYGPRLAFPRTEPALAALRESVRALPGWLHEVIGVFEYLDTPMPGFAYALWCVAALALVLLALRLGSHRDRLALFLAAGLAVATPVLLHAFVLRPIGWAVQGRHVLPIVLVLPLLAGEIAAGRTRFSAAATAACALVQFTGLYADAHRSAVGANGPWLFIFHPEWAPAGGWWPILALGFCGAGLIACSGLVQARLRAGSAEAGAAASAAFSQTNSSMSPKRNGM